MHIDLSGSRFLPTAEIVLLCGSRDSVYGQIRVWLDNNHDGISQPSELMRLSDAGVTALLVAYHDTPRMDNNGNLYKYEGSALVAKNGKESSHKLIDVILIRQIVAN
jgi:hypothetical protein